MGERDRERERERENEDTKRSHQERHDRFFPHLLSPDFPEPDTTNSEPDTTNTTYM